MAEEAQAQNACRALQMLLKRRYIEYGTYPTRLSLSDSDLGSESQLSSIRRGLSEITNYRTTEKNFSFTAVSISGRCRFHVTESDVKLQVHE